MLDSIQLQLYNNSKTDQKTTSHVTDKETTARLSIGNYNYLKETNYGRNRLSQYLTVLQSVQLILNL